MSVATNWVGGVLPATGDTVIIENSSASLLYGLSSLSAVTLAELRIMSSFTGNIGLPQINVDSSATYYEYRTTYFTVSATVINMGVGLGPSSGRVKIDVGSVTSTANIYNTGQPIEQGIKAFLFKGSSVSNAMNLNKGSVGIAQLTGETAKVATLRIGYTSSVGSDVDLFSGTGVTLTTVDQSGGAAEIHSQMTTLQMSAGKTQAIGAFTCATATIYGGTLYWRAPITTGALGAHGQLLVGSAGTSWTSPAICGRRTISRHDHRNSQGALRSAIHSAQHERAFSFNPYGLLAG